VEYDQRISRKSEEPGMLRNQDRGIMDKLDRTPLLNHKVPTSCISHPWFSVLRDRPASGHIPTRVMSGSLEAELETRVLVQLCWESYQEKRRQGSKTGQGKGLFKDVVSRIVKFQPDPMGNHDLNWRTCLTLRQGDWLGLPTLASHQPQATYGGTGVITPGKSSQVFGEYRR
jgi:hypothetical protein